MSAWTATSTVRCMTSGTRARLRVVIVIVGVAALETFLALDLNPPAQAPH
jgi:hypothetical protein